MAVLRTFLGGRGWEARVGREGGREGEGRGGWEGREGAREEESEGGRGGEGAREEESEGGRERGARAKSPIRPPTLRNITSSNVERYFFY